MIKRKFAIGFCFILIFSVGCSSGGSSDQGSTPDYQTTKKMVVDMLKSDDGEKAIRDILKEDSFKQQLLMNQDFVKDTIAKTLTSDSGKKFWQDLFSDPKFSTQLAKSMQANNKQLLKQLMKDPSYQSMMMDVLNAPKMQKEYLDLMHTQPFREEMQKTIIDTLSSPLFTEKLSNALSKTLTEQSKQGKGQGDQSSGQNSNQQQ